MKIEYFQTIRKRDFSEILVKFLTAWHFSIFFLFSRLPDIEPQRKKERKNRLTYSLIVVMDQAPFEEQYFSTYVLLVHALYLTIHQVIAKVLQFHCLSSYHSYLSLTHSNTKPQNQ